MAESENTGPRPAGDNRESGVRASVKERTPTQQRAWALALELHREYKVPLLEADRIIHEAQEAIGSYADRVPSYERLELARRAAGSIESLIAVLQGTDFDEDQYLSATPELIERARQLNVVVLSVLGRDDVVSDAELAQVVTPSPNARHLACKAEKAKAERATRIRADFAGELTW